MVPALAVLASSTHKYSLRFLYISHSSFSYFFFPRSFLGRLSSGRCVHVPVHTSNSSFRSVFYQVSHWIINISSNPLPPRDLSSIVLASLTKVYSLHSFHSVYHSSLLPSFKVPCIRWRVTSSSTFFFSPTHCMIVVISPTHRTTVCVAANTVVDCTQS